MSSSQRQIAFVVLGIAVVAALLLLSTRPQGSSTDASGSPTVSASGSASPSASNDSSPDASGAASAGASDEPSQQPVAVGDADIAPHFGRAAGDAHRVAQTAA